MRPRYLFSVSTHPDAIGVNALDITLFHPEIAFADYDYLILTSKQAVEALKRYDRADFITKKALCVSKATAAAYRELGGSVLDIGGGYGDNLIDKIISYDKKMRWLYLRAEVVASDFARRVRETGYDVDEVIVYKSECSKAIERRAVEKDAVLIFTSPSSVNCFLRHHKLLPTHTVVVIGKTTAKAIPNPLTCKIADEPTIQSCIDLIEKEGL